MVQAVSVPSRIGVENAVEVLEDLRAATAAGSGQVALDLAPLHDFDSSALSLLLHLVRERRAAGEDGSASGPFLLNPPEKLRELAELYGVEEMLFGDSAGRPDQVASA